MADIEKQQDTTPAVTVATTTATATPVGFTTAVTTPNLTSIPMRDQEKQGAKCCGFCCDYRRAVIIVDSVYMVFQVLSIIILIGFTALFAGVELDDDTNDELLDDVHRAVRNGAIMAGITILCSILAIIGANQYNIYMVGLNIVWLILWFILNITFSIQFQNKLEEDYVGDDEIQGNSIGNFIYNAVILALIIYPHAGFIHEVNRGIMSPETYPREEFSCCCTNQRRR